MLTRGSLLRKVASASPKNRAPLSSVKGPFSIVLSLLNEGYICSSLECRAMNGHVTVSGYKKNLYKKFNKCLIYILIYNAPDLIHDVR